MYEFCKETDGACFKICGGTIVESDEVMPGIIADFDAEGNVIGIEWFVSSSRVFLSISKQASSSKDQGF